MFSLYQKKAFYPCLGHPMAVFDVHVVCCRSTAGAMVHSLRHIALIFRKLAVECIFLAKWLARHYPDM